MTSVMTVDAVASGPARLSTTPAETPTPQRLRILLLEDNPSDARLTQEMLRDSAGGIACDIAATLQEVTVERLAHVDCALIDLGLPDASGLEALHRLRDLAPAVPIVVLTGNDDEATGVAALKQGAQDYLVKQHADGYTIVRAIRYATERKRLQLVMSHQALHDPLTGLPNRALFRDRVEHTLKGARRRGGAVAVLFADLDHFKAVNDSLGHLVGDELLVQVAERLVETMRGSDTIARFGGDEFTVLCDGLRDSRDAELVAERMRGSLAEPFLLAGQSLRVTMSIGVAVADAATAEVDVLLRDADTALYAAKASGRDRFVWFDQPLHQQIVDRLTVINDVREALTAGRLRPAYQMIVGVNGGPPLGYEALARLDDPLRGLLPPGAFAAAFDDATLVRAIDRTVLKAALADLAGWRRDAASSLWISVNASEATISARRFADDVLAALHAQHLPADALVIEVLETATVGQAASDSLARLRQAGVRIALDDFGAGSSSLSQFLTVSADIIKLDLKLTAAAGAGEPRARALFKLLSSAAAAVGLLVVAEGIETTDVLAMARKAGVPLAQGYLWGKPAPVANGLPPGFPSAPTIEKITTAPHFAERSGLIKVPATATHRSRTHRPRTHQPSHG